MNVCVYGASSSQISDEYKKEAFALGQAIARRGWGTVFGGGGEGLMGAVARGALSCGGEVIGVAPEFFSADGVLFGGCTKLVLTDTMRTRKMKMEELSQAFVMLPGGIGTFEEFFEIFTSKQLGLHSKAIAVLSTGGYYDMMEKMLENAVREKFMKDECMELYRVFSQAEEITEYILKYVPAALENHKR